MLVSYVVAGLVTQAGWVDGGFWIYLRDSVAIGG